jgi:hypothetical protein
MQEVLPGFSLSIAQQYTSFDTLQLDGDEIDNFDNERLQSSITQFVVGYTLNPRVQIGLSIPLISRHYRRTTPTGRETGDETGIGDITLLTRWALIQKMFNETLLNVDLAKKRRPNPTPPPARHPRVRKRDPAPAPVRHTTVPAARSAASTGTT